MPAASRFAPPSAPWTPLASDRAAGAYLSVYLSSPIARLPVRDVTKLGDNKSDPNLETLTYGLFSTCEPTMRGSILNRGIGEIFFLTRVEGIGRALVGRYDLGWSAEVGVGDVALAAKAARFIDPIPVDRIRGSAGRAVNTRLRNFKIVDMAVADQLRSLITGSPDRTQDYLCEIDRLERMSDARTGYRYPSWDRREPFSWDDAKRYLAETSSDAPSPNTSETGRWVCTACGTTIVNQARLKVCNVCGARGTLEPEPSRS